MDLIQTLLDFLHNLRPHLEQLVQWNVPGFYAVMFLIVFAETGLVVTPFLPGDSLLFLLGAMAAVAGSSLNLPLLFVLLAVAAVLGDAVNYHVGHYLGPKVFRYENSWLLHTKHLLRRRSSTSVTAARPSFWPASCRSCGRSHRSSPASAR